PAFGPQACEILLDGGGLAMHDGAFSLTRFRMPIEPAGKALLRPRGIAKGAALRARMQNLLVRIVAEHTLGRGTHHAGVSMFVDSLHEVRVCGPHLRHPKEFKMVGSLWIGGKQLLRASDPDTLGHPLFRRQQMCEVPIDVRRESVAREVRWKGTGRR